MLISKGAIAVWCLSVGGAAAFSKSGPSRTFLSRTSSKSTTPVAGLHSAGCLCPSCVSVGHPTSCACAACLSSLHSAACACGACSGRRGTALFADISGSEAEVPAEVEAEVPAEVEAMDGIASDDEAHNAERPARKELKKKRSKGVDLNELEIGSMVSGKVRSITSYGAFVDIGAQTDGLLHISQLAAGYVANVNDILKEGQSIEVRIVNVDNAKGQVGLSMMTEDEAAAGEADAPARRQGGSSRRDDTALKSLSQKGFDSSVFVEGTVVSTVDFGCFVRIDASLLNSECEGEVDGLVHISALGTSRVSSVTDVVKVDQKVQIRVKSIDGNKVSLTMLSVEAEDLKAESSGGSPREQVGAKDWKESLEKMRKEGPVFENRPVMAPKRR
jgi:predicted RNA-binding protein with RPS1 domain